MIPSVGTTPATRSTECAAAHRPCGRLPLPCRPPRAHERDVAMPAALRRAPPRPAGGWRERDVTFLTFLTRQPPPPPPPLPSPCRPCHAFVPFCSHPACPLPPPGRLLVARPLSRLSRGLSPLFILPVGAVEINRPVVGSPVTPVAVGPLSASVLLCVPAIEPAESDALSSGITSSSKVSCEDNIRPSPNLTWVGV